MKESKSNQEQVVRFKKRSTTIALIVVAGTGLFMVLPLPFRGPGYDVCHGYGSTCASVFFTTRRYWFGGYHTTIQEFMTPSSYYVHYLDKYYPLYGYGEVWLLALISLAVVVLSYGLLGIAMRLKCV